MIQGESQQYREGRMMALKHALTIFIRQHQTGLSGVPAQDIARIFLRKIEAEFERGLPTHASNAVVGEAEKRRGHSDVLKEIRNALERIQGNC